jgi:hypothetical protein
LFLVFAFIFLIDFLGVLGGSIILLGSPGVLAVRLLFFLCVLRVLCGSAVDFQARWMATGTRFGPKACSKCP